MLESSYRIVVYKSPDPGEVDFRYLAVALAKGGKLVDAAGGPTEDAARERLVRAMLLS